MQFVGLNDVKAGDFVSVTVEGGRDSYIRVTDTTRNIGGTYTYGKGNASPSEAESIEERPSENGLGPLADVNTTFAFNDVNVSQNYFWLSKVPHRTSIMQDCKTKAVMASPGAIASSNQQFTVAWKSPGSAC